MVERLRSDESMLRSRGGNPSAPIQIGSRSEADPGLLWSIVSNAEIQRNWPKTPPLKFLLGMAPMVVSLWCNLATRTIATIRRGN